MSVLDVGCGWGRWLEQLYPEFNIWGCDVSADMLAQVPAHLKDRVFELDIAAESFDHTTCSAYQVGICRGVLHYMLENDELFRRTVLNLRKLIRGSILVWELPEVCAKLAQLDLDQRFCLHPIERKSE